jgi:hypothetical protein
LTGHIAVVRLQRACTYVEERYWVRLFISHGIHGPDESPQRRLLDVVQGAFKASGHKVFAEKQLKPGDVWRSRLYHEIARCDGAVVLLDRGTLQSRWVQREVDLLLWRRALNPDLQIVPVVLDDTDVAVVRNGGYGEFTELQFLRAGRRCLSARELAAELVGLFNDVPSVAPSGMDRWFEEIELILVMVAAPERLWRAALALGLAEKDADRVLMPGGCRFLAHQFLGRWADTAAIDAVNQLLNCAEGHVIEKLVRLIAPAWVDGSAALPLVAHDGRGSLVAVLNARRCHTAAVYVRRATCVDARVRTEEVVAVAGEAGVRDLLEQCERAVVRLLGGDPDLGETLGDIPPDDVRNGLPYARFLIIDGTAAPKPVVADVVGSLRVRFRWLVVILVVGAAVPSRTALADWRFAEARVLAPPLGQHDEFKALRTERELLRMASLVSRGGRQG